MRKPSTKNCFYVRILHVNNKLALESTRAGVGTLGRILDQGVGTAKDPTSAWFEVEVREDYVERVREVLGRQGIPADLVAEAFPVDRGEGKLLARQLTLV